MRAILLERTSPPWGARKAWWVGQDLTPPLPVSPIQGSKGHEGQAS